MTRVSPALSNSLTSETAIAAFVFEKQAAPVGSFAFGSRLTKALETAKKDGFDGKLGQTSLIHLEPKGQRILFIGAGVESDATLETVRRLASTAARAAGKLKAKKLALRPPLVGSPEVVAQAATEGVLLGSYRYDRYKSKKDSSSFPDAVVLIAKNEAEQRSFSAGVRKGIVFSEATTFARDLINQGPSDTTPETLVKVAQKLSGGSVRVKVFGQKQLQSMGMGGILGVNRGSGKPAAFVHLTYKPRGRAARKIGLCGKGITFDSGGLSLKPAKAMETMKIDMSGAAAVFATFKALAALKPNVEVHGFTPLTENMPGCNATKPGDVLKTYRGKTIEVLNTDAEGRLVLADALGYASNQNLDEILDIATLTGACVIALGGQISGIMGTDKGVLDRLKAASERSGEKVWELPLEKEYRSHMDSPVADIKNIGRGEAGTIIGGLFLKEFVDEKTPWAHIDIAGPAWSDHPTPLSPAGGTGVMVRTFLEYILHYNNERD